MSKTFRAWKIDDPMLLPRAASLIGEQRINAEWALQQVFDHLGAVLDGVEDPYLRERKGDLADVVGRLRMNLTPGGAGFRDILGVCEAPCVLVADELPPSIAAQLDWTKFEAFITDAGSRTYHTAILARSLDVPMTLTSVVAATATLPVQFQSDTLPPAVDVTGFVNWMFSAARFPPVPVATPLMVGNAPCAPPVPVCRIRPIRYSVFPFGTVTGP